MHVAAERDFLDEGLEVEEAADAAAHFEEGGGGGDGEGEGHSCLIMYSFDRQNLGCLDGDETLRPLGDVG